ncbi:hypothetical protein MTAT_19380 [Moorella thermoacetica]|uniref:Uncharacterized protein n=1 Tax=Neomoorella thermoacetica TaxID=1525 RepID=A0AAC9HIN6_NEOTH|nr:hypothetical protein [Moorella thermoacetica]AOQ24595.1 hypothetical protein Maut_02165 [Moorella thermoacetica]TYL12696.1 hypothetical protein MTAT_19380 [Moorella thermoacetica]
MDIIYKQAENDEAILKIYYDTSAISPRDEMDNLGTMVCWHRRYDLLGDKHNYATPRDFLEDLASQVCDNNPELLNTVVENKFRNNYQLKYDATDSEWVIYQNGNRIDSYEDQEDAEYALQELKDELSNGIFDELDNNELMDIIDTGAVILPLYLYDHGGVTISTESFNDPWDSGWVGWIYVLDEDIKKEFHVDEITDEIRQKTVDILKGEVETYDMYLQGEVYGYVLEEKIKCPCCGHVQTQEIDSCWGFYGYNPKTNGIADYIPEEYQDLLDKLN